MKSFLIIIISSLALAGCETMPTKASFPEVPAKLMIAPVELQTLKPIAESSKIPLTDESASNMQLSAITKVITGNYKIANLYRAQILELQNWILEQKKLNP